MKRLYIANICLKRNVWLEFNEVFFCCFSNKIVLITIKFAIILFTMLRQINLNTKHRKSEFDSS